MALQEKGDLKKAIEELLKVDQKARNSRRPRKISPLYIKAGAVDEGVRQAQKLIETNSENVSLYLLWRVS